MKNRSTRVLILVMITLVVVSIVVSSIYYRNINASVDPRIVDARKSYTSYNHYASHNDFVAVFNLLDSIEQIYKNVEHYKNSYELGVLRNNRAAVYLTIALHKDSIQFQGDNIIFRNLSKDTLLDLAESNVRNSISNYEAWLEKFDRKNPDELKSMIEEDFYLGLENYSQDEKEKFLNKRIEEIVNAQKENRRRLSVSYTNLGIVYRHREDYDSAIQAYQKALELWDRNLTARNNINILLGKPLEKRNFIQKMFPPEKDKGDD